MAPSLDATNIMSSRPIKKRSPLHHGKSCVEQPGSRAAHLRILCVYHSALHALLNPTLFCLSVVQYRASTCRARCVTVLLYVDALTLRSFISH